MNFKNLKYMFKSPKGAKENFQYYKTKAEKALSESSGKTRKKIRENPEKAMGASATTGALLGYIAGSGGNDDKKEARETMNELNRKYARDYRKKVDKAEDKLEESDDEVRKALKLIKSEKYNAEDVLMAVSKENRDEVIKLLGQGKEKTASKSKSTEIENALDEADNEVNKAIDLINSDKYKVNEVLPEVSTKNRDKVLRRLSQGKNKNNQLSKEKAKMKDGSEKQAMEESMGGSKSHKKHHKTLEERVQDLEKEEQREEKEEKAKNTIDKAEQAAKEKVEDVTKDQAKKKGKTKGPGDTINPAVGMGSTLGQGVGYHGDQDPK